MAKREIAYGQFLLFPNVFYIIRWMSSANPFNLGESKYFRVGLLFAHTILQLRIYTLCIIKKYSYSILLTLNCNQNLIFKSKTSQKTVGPLVMSGKTGSSLIYKHQNTGPADRQNLAIHLIWNYIPQKVNKKQFYRINTKCSSWKIPNVTNATFRIYIGNISVM